MHRTSLLATLLLVTACQSTPPEPTALTNELTVTAQVVSVERANRVVTLRDTDGVLFDVFAGPEVRNFDQIDAGDTLRVRYRERLAAALRPAGEAPSQASGAIAAGIAPPGAKPGAGVGLTVSLQVRIESIDLKNDIVVFSLADGELVAHRLATDEGRAFAKGLKLGDVVQLDYEQALAVAVEEL